MSEPCPCIYPDADPDDGVETCECGHTLDEHDSTGTCQGEIEDE